MKIRTVCVRYAKFIFFFVRGEITKPQTTLTCLHRGNGNNELPSVRSLQCTGLSIISVLFCSSFNSCHSDCMGNDPSPFVCFLLRLELLTILSCPKARSHRTNWTELNLARQRILTSLVQFHPSVWYERCFVLYLAFGDFSYWYIIHYECSHFLSVY